MKPLIPTTPEEYEALVGHKPSDIEWHSVVCRENTIGHFQCGWCLLCMLPYRMCPCKKGHMITSLSSRSISAAQDPRYHENAIRSSIQTGAARTTFAHQRHAMEQMRLYNNYATQDGSIVSSPHWIFTSSSTAV